MAGIPVKGTVLKWAREFRGLSLEEAAARTHLPIEELVSFEDKTHLPSLTKFERIASAYRLPLATLFRLTPPTEPPEPSDFRTLESAAPEKSFEFRVALSNVRTLQGKLAVLQSDDQEFQAPVLRQYQFPGNAQEEGERERREIGISLRTQIDWESDKGFHHWRAVVERLGISVYLQKFLLTDCRGWSMWEETGTPAIIVNKSDLSENARTYTLIHEYAHLLIRRPGISDMNPSNPVEYFCNAFAAAFLMPVEALQQLLPLWPNGAFEWDSDVVRQTSRRLKVSAEALAIRLQDLGKAPPNFSRRFRTSVYVRKHETEGGNYVATRLNEIGVLYTESVISALERDLIDVVHASEALGLSPTHIDKARAYIERQHELASAG